MFGLFFSLECRKNANTKRRGGKKQIFVLDFFGCFFFALLVHFFFACFDVNNIETKELGRLKRGPGEGQRGRGRGQGEERRGWARTGECKGVRGRGRKTLMCLERMKPGKVKITSSVYGSCRYDHQILLRIRDAETTNPEDLLHIKKVGILSSLIFGIGSLISEEGPFPR